MSRARALRSWLLSSSLWLLSSIGSTAAAQPATVAEDAHRLYRAGYQAFEEGRLEVAESSFEAAYRLVPRPALLFDLAQLHRRRFLLDPRTDLLVRALDEYRRYIAQAPGGENRAFAEATIAELSLLLARQSPELLGTPPPPTPPPAARTEVMIYSEVLAARVSIDGQSPGATPVLAQVSPGPHRATVEAPGYFPVELHLSAIDGRLITAEARLLPRPGRLEIEAGPSTRVYLDGKAIGWTPLAPVMVNAGEHTLDLIARGRKPYAAPLAIGRDATTHVRVSLEPTSQRRAARWLLALGGVTAIGAVAGGGTWAQADSAAAALSDARKAGGISLDQLAEYQADRQRRDASRIACGVLLGVTGALALTGAALSIFDTAQPANR